MIMNMNMNMTCPCTCTCAHARAPSCSFSYSERLGVHAQMSHPHTRMALWAVLHPAVGPGERAPMLSAALNASWVNPTSARGRFVSVAFSSTLAGATCICRPGAACRMLRGADSHKTGLKRCKYWDLGAR